MFERSNLAMIVSSLKTLTKTTDTWDFPVDGVRSRAEVGWSKNFIQRKVLGWMIGLHIPVVRPYSNFRYVERATAKQAAVTPSDKWMEIAGVFLGFSTFQAVRQLPGRLHSWTFTMQSTRPPSSLCQCHLLQKRICHRGQGPRGGIFFKPWVAKMNESRF